MSRLAELYAEEKRLLKAYMSAESARIAEGFYGPNHPALLATSMRAYIAWQDWQDAHQRELSFLKADEDRLN